MTKDIGLKKWWKFLRLTQNSRLATRPPRAAEEEPKPAELAEIWVQRAYALAEMPPAETMGQSPMACPT